MKVTRSEGKAGPGVVDAAPTLLYDDNPAGPLLESLDNFSVPKSCFMFAVFAFNKIFS